MRASGFSPIFAMFLAACGSTPAAPATGGPSSGAPGSTTIPTTAGVGTAAGATAKGAANGGSGATTTPKPTAGSSAAGTGPAAVSGGTSGSSSALAGSSAAGTTATATAGTTGSAAGSTGSAGGAGPGPATAGALPFQMDVNTKGPYEVTVDMKAGANSWVFRPTDLGKDGVLHPIFVFGCGATSTPSQYMDHWTMVASHGFVVISPNNSMVDAAAMKASLDWIIAQNDAEGPYKGKLNIKKIAMGGHSLGSIATFDQEAMETRLTTTIHIAGGSFDGMGSSKVKTPTAYMCGQMDQDIASPQCKTDFDNVKDQPTYFVQLAGVDHVAAARQALPGIVGWLRWWLNGEDRKTMFVGSGCDFCKDKWANAMTKNF